MKFIQKTSSLWECVFNPSYGVRAANGFARRMILAASYTRHKYAPRRTNPNCAPLRITKCILRNPGATRRERLRDETIWITMTLR